MFLAIILMIIAVRKTEWLTILMIIAVKNQNGLNCAKESKVRAKFTGNTMSEKYWEVAPPLEANGVEGEKQKFPDHRGNGAAA